MLAAPCAPSTCVWFNGYGVMGFAVVSLPSVVKIETTGPSTRDHVNQSNTVPIRIKSRMATDGTATAGTATSGTATAGTGTAGTNLCQNINALSHFQKTFTCPNV